VTGPHLIYVADPMCSWCWGFAPVIDAVSSRFGDGLPIRLIMGGLRPGTTEPMTEAAKRSTRGHWEHVREASGQPFDMAFFDREGFVYDTEPAARAVVVVRRRGTGPALAYLKAVQHAFYAQNRDVTDPDVLAGVAEEAGLGQDGFSDAIRSEEARQETWTDFAISQKAGITGFPTLLAAPRQAAAYGIVTQGYQPPDRIVPVLVQWLETVRAAPAPAN
jgi:putative protein-disulfide isomerase